MNGADILTDTLLASGIDVCFANPGTSEMHFVAALDRKPEMRCVLGLSETVVTGAADGYARMADKPAATLLHTGPGLANGLANLHNARRARTPMVNIVGDHATHHLAYDAPLTSDIEGLARPMSDWVGRIADAADVAPRTREAITQARATPGVATLVLPADAAWTEVDASVAAQAAEAPPPRPLDPAAIAAAASALRSGRRVGLMMSGHALRADALDVAGRIAAATGARLLCQMSNSRVARGRGRVDVGRVPYVVDQALAFLADLETVILIGAKPPVAFFAYPGKPSSLLAASCEVLTAAAAGLDLLAALTALADAVGAGRGLAGLAAAAAPELPAAPVPGPLTAAAIMAAVARAIPDNAIVVDESVSSGRNFFALTAAAAPHDYLQLTGGAIGLGIAMATGAAIACPGRKVIDLQADGSALYAAQGLWTQAREACDVVTVILSNRSYAILEGEMRAVGVRQFGRNARRMLSLDEPAIDWVSLAKGFGVQGVRAATVEDFTRHLATALAAPGPWLIEAVI
ncbi:MAG: acetolactate synthase large subunit [Hyphomicrobiaceae bacterium]